MNISSVFNITLLRATVVSTTPILFAALAAVISQNANILNVGVEGIMLSSAFAAITVSYKTGSWILGVIVAVIVGIIIALILGVAHLKFKADVFAVGIVINILSISATRFLMRTILDSVGRFSSPDVVAIPKIKLSFLSTNPTIDTLFNNYNMFELLSIVLVAVVWYMLYKTIWGIRVRGSGYHSEATVTAGINPYYKKMQAMVVSGVIAGLGGAYMSLGYMVVFVENMVNGRGFMGVAAMFFGMASPILSAIGCFLFGFANALGARLQQFGVYPQFIQMIPYLITVIVYALSMYVQLSVKRKEKASYIKGAVRLK